MILVDILAGQSGEDVHVSNTIALVHVVRYGGIRPVEGGGIRPGGGMSGVGVVGDMFKAVIRISSNLILYCIPFVI
jgi:nitrogenase subunit NifH